MAHPNPLERTSILIGGIECDSFEQLRSAIDAVQPNLSAIFREVYPTSESFARTGYFGGPRTVPWVELVGSVLGNFDESGMNLILNLSKISSNKTVKPRTSRDILVRRVHDDELEGWKAAFSDDYIDPYGCVNDFADVLRSNITNFCARPGHYIAPYTCIVTSSMMGKSRLMKEVSTYIPTVYMCLGTNRNFYPHPTKVVVEWIRGGVEGMGYWHPSDKDFLVPTLKYCAFLLALIRHLPILVRQHSDENDYSWMWKFFAEPPEDCQEINTFWTQVTDNATSILRAKSSLSSEAAQSFPSPQNPSSPPKPTMSQMATIPLTPPRAQTSSAPQSPCSPQSLLSLSQKSKILSVSAESVRVYLAQKFGAELLEAYETLTKGFNVVDDKDFDMLLILTKLDI